MSGAATAAPRGGTVRRLEIGAYLYNNGHSGFFKGEIANVQTWNKVLTPDHIMVPSDNVGCPSGSSWTGPCSKMTFAQGLLSIKETCTQPATVTFGVSGNPDTVLVLQADGNPVIYSAIGVPLRQAHTYNSRVVRGVRLRPDPVAYG